MKLSPSLDTEESTPREEEPQSYRELRLLHCPDEYAATENLYELVDSAHDKDCLSQLHSCRTKAWFARERETGMVYVLSNSCRLRWCPLCSQARKAYMIQNITTWLGTRRNPKFLTLTLQHSSAPLSFQVDQLYKHFVNLRRHKQFRSYCRGGIWFFQVKHNPDDGLWHPHLHCLIDSSFIPQDFLSRLWLSVTKTSKIVDIRAVNKRQNAAEYISRYASRPSALKTTTPQHRLELYEALHGRKICGTWGTAKSVSLSIPRTPDRERFDSVGSWAVVTALYRTDPTARAIYDAWKTSQPIGEELTLADYDAFIDDLPYGSHLDRPPPNDSQSYLWT